MDKINNFVQQTVNEIDILIGVEKIDYGEGNSQARGELIEWSRGYWKVCETTKSTENSKTENSSIKQSMWAIITRTFNEVK